MAGKNFIDQKEAKELLEEGYSFTVVVMNSYQFRIRYWSKVDRIYDWFHTTGELCILSKSKYAGLEVVKEKFTDPENLAIFIKNDINKDA